ncbi:DUF5994 family protein [Streptomyces toxytricini]|uniref:DUF5994 family protein n=1 Tax=Streptomyces toxytricini TaxID=67369 RepID=A0ABW8EK42_STRT5
MTDAGASPHGGAAPQRLLPDEVHRAVAPGTALLRLETTGARQSLLDGAWWPRSRDVEQELPPLITALTEYLGPLTRVGLDASAWNRIPTRLVVDDRVVHLDSFPVGDDTVLITRGDNDHFSLMVVPPATEPEAARTAMARAVHAGNVIRAADILLAELHRPAGPPGGTVAENDEGPGL